jgi:hypothetical protein
MGEQAMGTGLVYGGDLTCTGLRQNWGELSPCYYDLAFL